MWPCSPPQILSVVAPLQIQSTKAQCRNLFTYFMSLKGKPNTDFSSLIILLTALFHELVQAASTDLTSSTFFLNEDFGIMVM